jgi:hypothetical protein
MSGTNTSDTISTTNTKLKDELQNILEGSYELSPVEGSDNRYITIRSGGGKNNFVGIEILISEESKDVQYIITFLNSSNTFTPAVNDDWWPVGHVSTRNIMIAKRLIEASYP